MEEAGVVPLTLNYVRRMLIGSKRNITLSAEMVDTFYFVGRFEIEPPLNHCLSLYWQALSRSAERFTLEEWSRLARHDSYVLSEVSLSSLAAVAAQLWQSDDFNSDFLEFRDGLLPTLLCLSQLEYDYVRELLTLLHNIDEPPGEAIVALGVMIPAFRRSA